MEKMNSEARLRRREYIRDWRAKNRDKVREYNIRYWTKRAAQEAAVKKEVHEKKEVNSVNG